MKKRFLLILISFFFIGACALEEEEELADEPDAVFDPPGDDADPPPELEELSLPSAQVCWANLISALWLCETAGQSYSYTAKQDPGTFNADGVTARVCELETTDTSLAPIYANTEKGHCVKRLNEEVGKRRDEGFNCRVVDEQTDGEPTGSCA